MVPATMAAEAVAPRNFLRVKLIILISCVRGDSVETAFGLISFAAWMEGEYGAILAEIARDCVGFRRWEGWPFQP